MTMNRRDAVLLGSCLLGLMALVACSGGAESGAGSDASSEPDPVAAGSELPPDHPVLGEQRQDQMIAPVDPAAGTGAGALLWDSPPSWAAETPVNTMRRAQYRVPGPSGDAECIVFYFGPGQGGDATANALRWANQFVQPDGSASTERLVTEEIEVGGIRVLKAEITGTYRKGGPMMGSTAELLPDHMLLGAVAAGPDSNWFFKLTGPAATVEANRAAFEAMLGSLRAGSA